MSGQLTWYWQHFQQMCLLVTTVRRGSKRKRRCGAVVGVHLGRRSCVHLACTHIYTHVDICTHTHTCPSIYANEHTAGIHVHLCTHELSGALFANMGQGHTTMLEGILHEDFGPSFRGKVAEALRCGPAAGVFESAHSICPFVWYAYSGLDVG